MTSVSGLALYTPKYTRYNQNYNYTPVNNVQKAAATKEAVDEFVVENGEKCTDGKDDGKIGFFSKLFNAAKGVVKTVVNGVKGMFTDSEGNFSLGKTLLSVATTAACIAFPAVGLVACGIGAVVGGVQVINGISKASQAKTDAEAKEAWQNIGGGGFTVAMSVVGAKAGLKAVGRTSTATNGLASLGKDATLGQKAAALGRDMWSSTKNSAANIKQTAGAFRALKQSQKAIAKDATSAEINQFNNKFASYSEQAQQSATKLYNMSNTAKNAVRHPFQTVKAHTPKSTIETLKAYRTLRKTESAIIKDADTAKISKLNNKFGGYSQTAQTQAMNLYSKIPTITIKSLPSQLQQVANYINNKGTNAAIQQFGYNTVAEVLQYAVPTQLNVQS